MRRPPLPGDADSMKRLLDASGALRSTFHYDEADRRVAIRYDQDVAPVLERNKRAQTADGWRPREAAFYHAASVPVVLLYRWLIEDGISIRDYMRAPRGQYRDWLRRKIYDPDNRFVLVAPHRR